MSISDAVVPLIIAAVVLYGIVKRIDVYSAFAEGAKDGLKTAVGILPQLVGLLVAVRAFSSSGAADLLVEVLRPAAKIIKFPA